MSDPELDAKATAFRESLLETGVGIPGQSAADNRCFDFFLAAILESVRADAREETERLRAALEKINTIRNSIVGLQTLNWNEHVYPLVAALTEAGIEGMGYPKARPHFGSMLDRTNAAEDRITDLCRHIYSELRDLIPGIPLEMVGAVEKWRVSEAARLLKRAEARSEAALAKVEAVRVMVEGGGGPLEDDLADIANALTGQPSKA